MQVKKSEEDRPVPTSPPCFKCGAQLAYSTNIQEQPTGRLFHMFGELRWFATHPNRAPTITIPLIW
jgi:hypothetical protein